MRMKAGDPEMARELNRALILHLMRVNESISRVEIARHLKLSKGAISTIMGELLESGDVVEIGEGVTDEKGGRRPILLELNRSKKFVIGVDIGTTNMATAVGDLKGSIMKNARVPTSREPTVENIIRQVSQQVHNIIKEAGVKEQKLAGIGVSVAGQINKNLGFIVSNPHFHWREINFAKMLQERIGLKTIVNNCTRVMTIGETWFGKGKGIKNFIFITVSYGLGSALVIEGRIYDHHSEFGHIFVTKNKIKCPCGKYGCLEVVASGSAIERQANELIAKEGDVWITAKDTAELARGGDRVAGKIYNETGRYLGRGLSVLANTLNPERIIIGGGISLAGELLLNPVKEEFNENTMDVLRNNIEIYLSPLGQDAGVMGAIAMALNDLVFNFDIVSMYDYSL
jgi:glucokinase-like ROK family protein